MPEPELYAAVARAPKLADRVAQQLQNLITSQQLHAGERLPPERDLAAMFAVSRTVVREAVRSLVAKGLLEVQSGSGTFVRAVKVATIAESLGLLLRSRSSGSAHAFEVRQLLEVEIARLAAARALPSDIEAMEQAIRELPGSEANPDRFAQIDVAFHTALARATQNELFVILLNSIGEVLLQIRRETVAEARSAERALFHHRRILERVKARDAEGAQEAMRAHLEDVHSTLARLLSREGQVSPEARG
jgi:GntR family transcriptional regulator, transcriptional repressor for pyruvate dehydrogenase complex